MSYYVFILLRRGQKYQYREINWRCISVLREEKGINAFYVAQINEKTQKRDA